MSFSYKRFSMLKLFFFLFLVSQGLCAGEELSIKKGIAISPSQDPDGSRMARLNVFWHYNWAPLPTDPEDLECFVPMYSGNSWQLKYLAFPAKRKKLDILLTHNEPDRKGHRMWRTVDQVVAEWPKIDSLAKRLSSPAGMNSIGGWMRKFISEADRKNLRYDFVPVHWFGPPDAKLFFDYLETAYQLYKKPLWVTEFAVIDRYAGMYGGESRFSHEQVIGFMREVLPGLESKDYVERYAWASVSPKKAWLSSSLLFDADGVLTPAGEYYASFKHGLDRTDYCGQ